MLAGERKECRHLKMLKGEGRGGGGAGGAGGRGGGGGHLSSRAVQPGTQRQETWILELLLPYFE